MKVCNFGSLNLDYVYTVNHFVMPGETLAAASQQVNPGGKGLNQSIALARAGINVFHAGCIGVGGEKLKKTLSENGVNVDFLRQVDEIQGNAVIQVNSAGENCILLFGGSNQCVTSEQIDETLNKFSCGDYLVLQNEINRIDEMIEKANKIGMKIVLNPSPFDEKLKSLDFNKISWILINEVEAEQLTGQTDPKKALNTIRNKYQDLNIVLTLGANGAYCSTRDKEIYVPSVKTNVVDTTAAGDTFTGYFLAYLMNNKSLEECMEKASKAASVSVSRPGAAESIPHIEEIDGNTKVYDSKQVKALGNNPLFGKNVLFLGSSVTFGAASLQDGIPEYFQKRFSCQITKEAVSGTTLVDTDETSYVSRLTTNIKTSEAYNLLVCQLSTNDATKNLPLGDISDSVELEKLNATTITGAMEYIIAYAKQKWDCPIFFYTNAKYDSVNYEAMVNRLYELQKKWGIGILDLWNSETFNAISDDMRSLYMADPIHPTKAGYMKWWCPEIEKQLLHFSF